MCLQYINAASTVLEGQGKRNALNAQAKAARIEGQARLYEGELDSGFRHMEADNTMAEAQSEADNIRQQAIAMRSQAVVAQSGSGVAIGEGSAQSAVDEIQKLASADALAVLYSGANKAASLRSSGRLAQQTGRNQNLAANESANSLTAAGKMTMFSHLVKAGNQVAKK